MIKISCITKCVRNLKVFAKPMMNDGMKHAAPLRSSKRLRLWKCREENSSHKRAYDYDRRCADKRVCGVTYSQQRALTVFLYKMHPM